MIYLVTYKKGGVYHATLIDAKCARDAEIFFKMTFKEEVVGISEDTEELHKRGASVRVVPDDFEAVFPVTYEEMENYVRKQVEDSWDFVEGEYDRIYMTASIQGKYGRYRAIVLWIAGEDAEERTWEKAKLEAESLYELTHEEAILMRYSCKWGYRDLSERFFNRIEENKEDFWEAEYMAAMDEPETEANIKILAEDLWKQWKGYELDE